MHSTVLLFLYSISVAGSVRDVLLWGGAFVGAPVRPNMLNMLKSASGGTADHEF